MDIKLNGEATRVESVTIGELARELNAAGENILALLNGELAPKDSWENLAINEGDSIDFIALVSGG